MLIPELFPTLPLDFPKQIIKVSDLRETEYDPDLYRYLETFAIPSQLLERVDFDHPEVIIPPEFPTFQSLWERREDIRNLRLLPVKNDEEYNRYHAHPKEDLIKMAQGYIADCPLALAPNEFPYWLPDDLDQYILWVREDIKSNDEIWEFFAKVIKNWQLRREEYIIFERILKTNTKIVRGSLPEVRHLHFWVKKKGNLNTA